MTAVRPTCLVTCLLLLCGPAAAAPPAAVLITVDKSGEPKVEATDPAKVESSPPQRGLLVWADARGVEHWEIVQPGWRQPTLAELIKRTQTAGATRGSAGAEGGGVAQFAFNFEQINPLYGTRDVGIDWLTPDEDGTLLDPKPTFRRGPGPPGFLLLPTAPEAATADLTAANLPKGVKVVFKAGQREVAFADLKGLPPDVAAKGLPAGAYTVGTRRFVVADAELRERVMRPVNKMAELVGAASPLAVEFAFDQLFGDYPSTALDRLDRAGPKALSKHLRARREWLLIALTKSKKERDEGNMVGFTPPVDPTGVAEIDKVRTLIADAKWSAALAELDGEAVKGKADGNKQVAGLAALYRGVILAESSAAKEADARQAFEEAIKALADNRRDLFRARVNYGNFLQQRANDRLNDRALQMAARVEKPMLHVLDAWMAAREQYEQARPLGGAGSESAMDVNVARLYSLLADVIRALAPPDKEKDGFTEGVDAAGKRAKELAERGAKGATDEPLLRGIAHEVSALVDFRTGNDAGAEKEERQALDAYLEGGFLAGAENVYRVLGLVARRNGRGADALRNLEVAQIISEALRSRFPPDKTGLARAGFFARKAYVTEMMVELLLEQNKPLEALRQLELAKARGLQDLLAPHNLRPDRKATRPARDMLDNWDKTTAAVEYFLGSDRAYVFVVAPDGSVSAHSVRDDKGDAVPPARLIADVTRVLKSMEGQAGKMFDRLVAGRGYDNSWEDDMALLRRELLPDPALEKLRGATTVAVVPQHILHYFPFAALVVKPDPQRTAKRMARPQRLLIDEPFHLVYAPSLSAWSLLRSQKEAGINAVRAVGLVEAPGAPALEGVATDLKNLQEVFKDRNVEIVTAEKARVKKAQDVLNAPGLVFYATHGINVADHPLDSHLLLLPEPGAPPNTPGELTAAALFERRQPIGAQLIIMSACYSGLGDRSPMPGDDLYGLQRAFLQGGARTVVSGLWDVYDGTAPDLMRGMFEGLQGGVPAAEALARTQRKFLAGLRATGKDEPWLHPYFWAVYTCAGDDRTHMMKVMK